MHLETPFVKRICEVWPNVWHDAVSAKTAPKDDYLKWRWLWDNAKFDIYELGRATGDGENVLKGIDVAITNKLIYPDGTVNSAVDMKLKFQYLTEDDKIQLGLTESK